MALGTNLEELEPLLFQLPVRWRFLLHGEPTETKEGSPKTP